MNPRTEPLLWIQLLGLALWPLEVLLLLLVLAGSDPGPVPLVEEVLCWSLGALAPALLLWRAPADVWSLLLVQIPARGRRDPQQRLSRLQETLPLKLLGPGFGALALLPLLIRLDHHAAIAASLWSPGHLPRLVALLLGAVVLSLVLWQWQQAVQAIWLLSRSEAEVRSTAPLSPMDLERSRLSLGLPLLLPAPLTFAGGPQPPERRTSPTDGSPSGSSPQPPPQTPTRPAEAAGLSTLPGPPAPGASGQGPPAFGAPDPSAPAPGAAASGLSSAINGLALPVEPEQAAADAQGHELDDPVG